MGSSEENEQKKTICIYRYKVTLQQKIQGVFTICPDFFLKNALTRGKNLECPYKHNI